MTCYTPLIAFRAKDPNASDSSYITFKSDDQYIYQDLQLPCGKCLGCKLDYARQWAIRCVHEASLHEKNCFLTITYNDENCPQSLNKIDFQLFMKRLRFKYPKQKFGQISYFMCGEYGEKFSRPHYHVCLFGFDFPDKKFIKNGSQGDKLYTSEILDSLWEQKGHCWIGDVTVASASYVARYTSKKVGTKLDSDYYGTRLPEFTLCSRRPSVGLRWIEKYHHDVFNYDLVYLDGKKQRPPRYYDKFLEKIYPNFHENVKIKREENSLLISKSDDSTLQRRNTIHEVQLLRQKNISRPYESESSDNSDRTKLYDQRVVDYYNQLLKE